MKFFRERGFILFCVILILVLFASLGAYQISGHRGIEERFQNAVGLVPDTEEEDNNSLLGFAIEGNGILYIFMLCILVIICFIAYRSFRI